MKDSGETSGSTKRLLNIVIWIIGIVILAAVVLIMVFMFRRNTYDITVEEAKEIALADAGVTVDDVTYTKEELDRDDGVSMYELEFYTEDMKYQYEVNGKTGDIYSKSKETVAGPKTLQDNTSQRDSTVQEETPPEMSPEEKLPAESLEEDAQRGVDVQNRDGQISIEEAKNTALSDAGADASQVVFIKEQLDYEDGVPVYDIEFYTSSTEYEYEINAETGAIYSKQADVHGTNQEPHAAHSDSTEHSGDAQHYNGMEHTAEDFIGEEEAKSIAVNHAGLSVQDVNFLKAELDIDDGQAIYEIEFYKQNQEYDYKIDALTGAIMEYSLD